jgi:hypothetical protein
MENQPIGNNMAGGEVFLFLIVPVAGWYLLRNVLTGIVDDEPIEPTKEQREEYEAERVKDPLQRKYP